jgi:hypothetical protein
VSADDEPMPKVTPSLLRAATTMCPRRLHAEYTGAAVPGEPVSRARMREAFLDAARVAHAEGGAPRLEAFRPPPSLEPEEQRVFAHAAGWYRELYGDREVTTHLHDCERPTASPARGVRVGGWVDLTVTGSSERGSGEGAPEGGKELRQLELWGGRAPAGDDPLELESVWLAVLRLARWAGDDPLLVSWADLVRGDRRERVVHVADELPALGARFDEQLDALRERVTTPDAQPGRDCGSCRHLWRCPAHPNGINVAARRGDIRPGVITITPTVLDAWTRCRRMWRNQHLLSIAASDESGSPDHGQRLHEILRFVHDHGSCHDEARVEDVLVAHGGGERLRDEIARHAQRCPSPTEAFGHEVDVARFHKGPWPPFMATARLDAVWVHDGILDARDYKTGKVWYGRVADDPRALVQAWVLGPAAAARGLRLRLRYEHLAAEVDDDPEPWELDLEELDEVEERLREIVEAMHAEDTWAGVAEDMTCRACRYRSICPDSATPGEPLWPAVEDEPLDRAPDPSPVGS